MTTIDDENPFGSPDLDEFEEPDDCSPFVANGRYVIIDPDNPRKTRRCTRASTFADTLPDMYHLEQWKIRKSLKGLTMRPDLFQLVAAHDPDDRDHRGVFKDVAEKAMDTAEANKGSHHGTAVHAQTELADAGQDLGMGVSTKIDVTVRSYSRMLDEHAIKTLPSWTERIIWNRELNIVGRLDRALFLSDPNALQHPTFEGMAPFYAIGDTKTQKVLNGGDLHIGVQLAVYSRADKVWNAEAQRWEDPDIELSQDWAFVMHAPSTDVRCDLQAIDLRLGWKYALLSAEVRKSRNEKNLAILIGSATHNRWASDIVKTSTTEQLAEIWKRATESEEWTADLFRLANARRAEIENGQE